MLKAGGVAGTRKMEHMSRVSNFYSQCYLGMQYSNFRKGAFNLKRKFQVAPIRCVMFYGSFALYTVLTR